MAVEVNKNQMIGIIAAICVALILFIYLIGRNSGKLKAQANNMAPVKLPNNGTGIPQGWSPDPLISELYDAMKGLFAWSSTRENAYSKITALTRDQRTALYNRWNQLHGDKNAGSLTEWIRDEAYSGPQQQKAIALLENDNLP